MESIFKYAIFHYNRLANDAHNLTHKINLQAETLHLVSSESTLQTVDDVCSLVHQRRVQGIFGPPCIELATLAHSICCHINIPFINVCSNCYDPENLAGDAEEEWDNVTRHDCVSINLYPSNEDLNIAFHNLTHKLQWNKFIIIYDIESGLTRLQRVLNDPGLNQTDILVRPFTHINDRSALLDAIGRDVFNIILDLNDLNTHAVLKMALQMGMISSSYHFLLTTLNIDSYDLEDFKYNFVNLTAFRLFRRDDQRVKSAMDSFLLFKTMPIDDINQRLFTTSVALWVDAVLAYAYAYDKLITSYGGFRSEAIRPNISCVEDNKWPLGAELGLKFSEISFDGITGTVKFTPSGKRTGFELDIVHLTETGLTKIGVWSREQGANFTLISSSRGTLFNSTLIVTTIIGAPYVIYKHSENATIILNQTYSNSEFEGFCIDLLDELSRELKFYYKIKPITTGRYDDMVEEVKNKVADLAVAPLTINYAREKKIDFTKPFLSLGIAILFKLPKPEKPGLFSFLSPLSLEIWIYTFVAIFTVSFILLLIARCSPDEWRNPYPCDAEYDYLENRFTVSNTLWFSIGTLMQQGSDVSPSAISTRLVSGIWWFFTLILISSYTANLAAFLTVEKLVNPIETAEDLAKQTKIKYGLVSGGSTEQFFRESTIPIYQAMWKFMISNPEVFAKNSQDGIDRVKSESYAFFMESTSIEYTVQRECNLTQIGGLLDNKGYGIGLPEGSPHRERFSEIILDLQEKGIIQKSYNKWWKGKGTCSSDKKDSKANPLGLTNVGGIFVVLLGGIVLSIFVAILEFLWHARKNHADRRHSVWWELLKEVRFSIQCGASNRKALSIRRCSQCKSDQNDSDPCTLPHQRHRRSLNSHSSSLTSVNFGHTSKTRTTTEKTPELDRFDSILMLATEKENHFDSRSRRRQSSTRSQRKKSSSLLLIEQQPSNHVHHIQTQQVRFNRNPDSSVKHSLKSQRGEDDNGNSADVNVPLSSSLSTNSRFPLRVSRL
ncbi:unnamed protein product [Rotaria magnacalcarata]|nr:unnamed protein product [Rotaria magnacalcarata]CAF2042534.1 unnamed protein product [Rotaria magnacalcarata]CAF2093203.1 unnamed protein product [Rotaria magnacalcarata]CAF2205699.1 unnamed protein product [Rotaria magnacalcarata]CAF3988241.1 unnamed protein product [Rotaria magnacalcarata]